MKKPLIIDALRHGETVKGQCYLGRTDAELTSTGWLQMVDALETTIQTLWQTAMPADIQTASQKKLQVNSLNDYDAIITSPLVRCKFFAEQWLAPKLLKQKSIRVDPAIQEYNFGLWDGRTAIEIMQDWPEELAEFWRDPENFPPPEAELLPLFFQRLRKFIDNELQSSHSRILLITHGGVIKALTCLHQDLPASSMASISVKHGGLHRFVWDRI